MKFDIWYEQHKQAIHLLGSRQDVAFYVWNNKPTSAKTSAKNKQLSTQDFELFWESYPNKTAKHVALIAWTKTKPPVIDVMHALDWQKKQQQWLNENGKYIPHAATYLNQRRWEDVPQITVIKEEEYYTDMNGCKRLRRQG